MYTLKIELIQKELGLKVRKKSLVSCSGALQQETAVTCAHGLQKSPKTRHLFVQPNICNHETEPAANSHSHAIRISMSL